jgi:hypothetical protein
MTRIARHKLRFGPYHTPRFRYGQRVECLARGDVTIVGLSDGRIPWPIGQARRGKSFVLYRDLARAVRREAIPVKVPAPAVHFDDPRVHAVHPNHG